MAVLALQIIAGIALRIFVPRFRGEANGLLGLAAVEILLPVVVFALATLTFWLNAPRPCPDALSPHPVWHTIWTIPVSLILMLVGVIIMLKVIIQSALAGVRKLENKPEDNNNLNPIKNGVPFSKG